MAEDVNNADSLNKVDERKIVTDFCQLQEKSRSLFNALRFNNIRFLFVTIFLKYAKNLWDYSGVL